MAATCYRLVKKVKQLKRILKYLDWVIVLSLGGFVTHYVWEMDEARRVNLVDSMITDLIFAVIVFGVLFLSKGRLEKPIIKLIAYFEPIVNRALVHEEEDDGRVLQRNSDFEQPGVQLQGTYFFFHEEKSCSFFLMIWRPEEEDENQRLHKSLRSLTGTFEFEAGVEHVVSALRLFKRRNNIPYDLDALDQAAINQKCYVYRLYRQFDSEMDKRDYVSSFRTPTVDLLSVQPASPQTLRHKIEMERLTRDNVAGLMYRLAR